MRGLTHDTISEEDGSALMCATRNAFIFDLKLPADRRVLLINYEYLVNEKRWYVETFFDFIDCSIYDNHWESTYTSSVRKHSPPNLGQPIAEVFEGMFRKLEGLKAA
jgi:hypothetical protein